MAPLEQQAQQEHLVLQVALALLVLLDRLGLLV